MPQSDLCVDAQALAASNGQTTPPGTLPFLAKYGRVAGRTGFAGLRHVLERVQTPADAKLVRDINRLTRRAEARLKALAKAEHTKLLSALGISS
jgi:hypothetical protein